MKNTIFRLIFVLMLVLGASFSSQAACTGNAFAKVPTDKSLSIDGTKDQLWSVAPVQTLTVPTTGSNSNAGTWRAMYDDNYLYLLFEIIDSQPMNNTTNTWDGDAIELYFGTNPSNNATRIKYCFCYKPGNGVDYGQRESSSVTKAETVKGSTTATGYLVEVKIAKSQLGGSVNLSTGGSVRMEVCSNGTDNAGGTIRAYQTAWKNSSTTHGENGNNYSAISFSDCGDIVNPTAVNIGLSESSMSVGMSIQATAIVSPSGADQSVTWSSSNPSVATIDAEGKITALSTGSFTVTATSAIDGTIKGTSQTITVSAAPSLVCNNSLGVVQVEDESPKIDNLIDVVWAKAPKNAINKVVNGSGNPANAGTWRALYDSDNLYFLIEITDPSKQGSGTYNGDGIEIYIDGNGNGGTDKYTDTDDAALKFAFSGTSVGTSGTLISGNKAYNYKMYDTSNGYTLEVAVPWTNIGGYPSSTRNMKVAVAVNQANAGGGRHSIVASNALNDQVYQYVNNIVSNVNFCRTTDYTISGDNESVSCMGDLINMTIDGLPDGATPTWQVYDTKTSAWVTDTNAKLIDGKWVLMADNKKHRIVYNSKKSNIYTISAATCCSSEVGSYVLWNQDFGTLGSNCARKDFDPSWGVIVSGAMTYSNGFVDDGNYAIVANPGCGEFGNNGGNPWFYSGEDHTSGDTNGAMLLVNNGARESVVFSQYVESPCDNATVDFSAWFANICRVEGDCGAPVNLTFKVSGKNPSGVWEEIDISNMSTGDIRWKNSMQWEKKNTSFNTLQYSDLYIQVINLGTSGQGNDVAIDDFEFVSCAPILNLYTDISTYAKTSVACEDKIVTLVPKAPMELEELYQPLYYMLQVYDNAQGKWKSASGISTPSSNPLPSWEINTADLPIGTNRYRVVMGNNAETVEIIANGGKPTAQNCILYTVTDEAMIEKSTLDLVEDKSITQCEGTTVNLTPEKSGSKSVSWSWKKDGANLCSGTSAQPNDCDKEQNVVLGSDVLHYTYTAVDAFSCTQTTNFTVTPQSPKYKFTQDDEVCVGESVDLKVSFTNATAPYTFVFSDGTNTENISTSSNPWTRTVTPTATTTYSVKKVKDKNCSMAEE